MRSRLKIIPPAAASLLLLGCQSSPPAASDGLNSGSGVISQADDASAFPATRTATLWVRGLACPF